MAADRPTRRHGTTTPRGPDHPTAGIPDRTARAPSRGVGGEHPPPSPATRLARPGPGRPSARRGWPAPARPPPLSRADARGTGQGAGVPAPDTSPPARRPPDPQGPPKGRASALYILPAVYFSPVFDRTSGPPGAGRGAVRFVRFGRDRTNPPSPPFAGCPCWSGTCSGAAGWQGGAYQGPGIGCQCPHLGAGFLGVCQLFVRCHSAPKVGEFFLPTSGYW